MGFHVGHQHIGKIGAKSIHHQRPFFAQKHKLIAQTKPVIPRFFGAQRAFYQHLPTAHQQPVVFGQRVGYAPAAPRTGPQVGVGREVVFEVQARHKARAVQVVEINAPARYQNKFVGISIGIFPKNARH